MQCQTIIYEPEGGGNRIQCPAEAEFSVKLGTVWGHYCRTHALEAVENEGETVIKPFELAEAEE
jgi:hypothetical protein